MSMLKSLASFVVSSIFIISLYLAITSYAMGDLIQKENIKGFIQSQLNEETAPKTCEDLCINQQNQGCEEYCNGLSDPQMSQTCKNSCSNDPESKEMCVQSCLSKANESEQYVNNFVESIYNRKIIGDMSLNDIAPIFKSTVLLLIISLIFGVSIFFVSEKPVSKIGGNFVWVGISLLSLAVIPAFIVSSDMSVVKMISDYITKNIYTQAYIGVILLVAGIALVFIGKKKKK